MKKVYVSSVDRTQYEIHRAPHHFPGEKAIDITEDEFVKDMRILAEYKALLRRTIERYNEDE